MSNSDRTVIAVSGGDARKFLQDLITNDMNGAQDGLIYAALLTPQGKYLFDFFVTAQGDGYVIDVASARADALIKRLSMYRLRADVTLNVLSISVSRGVGDAPEGALPDPRHSALGWRHYGPDYTPDTVDWNAVHVQHLIAQTDIELIADETYILEAGFERLNGVDFKKGCYVGQEVTARMKHKTELQKGLARVALSVPVPVGTDITRDGKSVGRVFTQSNGQAIAYLRFNRTGDGMMAGAAEVTLL